MKQRPLYEEIYNEIYDAIRKGEYLKGDRIPSEKELAEKYHVSRITSKAALEKLSEQGYIRRLPGKGSFVTVPKEEEMAGSKNIPRRGRLIGVIMDGFGASFGCQILLGIENECEKRGVNYVLRCSFGKLEEESKAIDEMIALGVEGIIIMCVHDENYNSKVLKLVVEDFPVVAIDRRLKGIPVSFVGTDNAAASKELTGYLLDRGYRNICFVSPDAIDTPTIAERQSGFVECCMERGLITNESMWMTDLRATLPKHRTEENLKKDIERISDFVKEHKETNAFFVVEYELARIVYRALCKLGLEKERPVVCFDEVSNIMNEFKFTHIRQDEDAVGVKSVELLDAKIKGDKSIKTLLVPYALIEANE
ncbi:GntR family transcriptional regulator [Anaerocolumna xylanovorans]|uniref:DNA-binding transcriptional regulator, LacI/PurR family n=1 Tax=Anaerocolumna xylanovorans DSM 12503 TaxID=1121345 RepID=A0A1M7Y8D1_9FIRM|nr:LacI family DNA-binding transcriptional regulator [Anaerocolumna xylanovorans]SHO48892.1 DNA-binding transcriptional regulator, LacI/PurR family [Anaerocolumna xylanovorans DSM 12503]